tara:strand:- start:2045 stop:2374 length:330 start_codon:yes stop_codon:yes gene_type:complete
MILIPGTLVKLNFNKSVSPENLVLAPTEGDFIKLYEKIDIESYPGWNDFRGYSKLFKDETLLVVAKKGRPLSFSKKEKWDLYDVYCVSYANRIYECFSYCMEGINVDQP